MKDPRIEAAAKALNTAGWTCYEGSDEPGQYDECEGCKRYCDTMASAALAAADKAATITTIAELDALPVESVILDSIGLALQLRYDGCWWCTNGDTSVTAEDIVREGLPARVIHWGNK